MSTITAADVKRLRDLTDAPMMNCKAALTQANGDLQKAIQILREQNKDIAGKKAERETAEGRIAIFIDGGKSVAAIVELRCESAPVAKSEQFIELAIDVARSATGAASIDALLTQPFGKDEISTVRDRIEEVVGLIRENMKIARFAGLSGGQFGSYVHFDGSIGVLLQVEGSNSADAQMLKDICMHITAKQPTAARREEVDPAVVAREREIVQAQIKADPKNSSKPANIIEKIAEGKLKTWFADNVLVEQPFVKDDSKTVGDLLKSAGLTVKRFLRYKVGELAS